MPNKKKDVNKKSKKSNNKSLKRKSLKRKSLKRKSLKRKPLKRKSHKKSSSKKHNKKQNKKQNKKVNNYKILEIPNNDSPSDLDNMFKDGLWIVLYYADWCPHCVHMKPEWEQLKKENLPINIVDIESTALNDINIPKDIEGFPTVDLFSNGNKIDTLMGERNLYNMMNMIYRNL